MQKNQKALIRHNLIYQKLSRGETVFTGNSQIEEDLNNICNSMDSVWWNGERQRCLLKVSGIAKYYIERDLPDNMEMVEEYEAYVVVHFYYHNEIELFSFVKSWIPHIRILDDDELAEKLDGELREFLNQ